MATPASERVAPTAALREMATPKNARPNSNIQIGVAEATSVTLIGVEVFSAMYCKAL